MYSGKVDRSLISRDRNAIITERIKGGGRSDKLRGGRIKDRIGLIHDAIESRDGYLLSGLDVLELAVAKRRVVAPGPVKELVSFDADGAEPGIGFVVAQSISKLSEPSAGAARGELI